MRSNSNIPVNQKQSFKDFLIEQRARIKRNMIMIAGNLNDVPIHHLIVLCLVSIITIVFGYIIGYGIKPYVSDIQLYVLTVSVIFVVPTVSFILVFKSELKKYFLPLTKGNYRLRFS